MKVVDRRRQSCDEEPAAGARMTSSQDQDAAEADKGEDDATDRRDSDVTRDATATASATGQSQAQRHRDVH